MSQLYKEIRNLSYDEKRKLVHRIHISDGAEELLKTSSTLYVGNLSFYTTEEQIFELFSKCGEIKRIIMGLDRFKKTPCGFCFVEYYTHEDAEDCINYISGSRLDDRIIRADWDVGFKDGRQYGRGKTGGQVRDELRTDYDPGRGGYGKLKSPEMEHQSTKTSIPEEENRKRGRESFGSISSKRYKRDDDKEKNPRFREGNDDSEEEAN